VSTCDVCLREFAEEELQPDVDFEKVCEGCASTLQEADDAAGEEWLLEA
jgi:hypothetical protein